MDIKSKLADLTFQLVTEKKLQLMQNFFSCA